MCYRWRGDKYVETHFPREEGESSVWSEFLKLTFPCPQHLRWKGMGSILVTMSGTFDYHCSLKGIEHLPLFTSVA